jgi:hypothetical protein
MTRGNCVAGLGSNLVGNFPAFSKTDGSQLSGKRKLFNGGGGGGGKFE